MASTRDLADRLVRARANLVDLRPVVVARRPWPLSESIGVEAEAHWGPPEVLAHVAEMLPFWLGEIERILDGDREPVPFGRVAAKELRIGIIERDRSLPLAELDARIDAGVERFAGRVGALTPAEAERRGIHPTLGEMTVARVAEKFVVGHLEEHVRQLAEVLEAGPRPASGVPAEPA